ncbi:rod shape-determining protein MreD [Phormidium sp. CCY1219]|uniref:rod shape-determining protein MreD n=1 Tax=Phormidium sp. CCY1219 TaxID=2886104 RepID=UPI002D1E8316|nr:rod shape-determining protein MreD [Phormidium sp. CCY1219]MEB3828818.1 rod shape-determining protein MreD [Phormidium sp. CCY1219]
MRNDRFTASGRNSTNLKLLNAAILVGSVALCLLLMPTRFPGTELLGVSPNWLLIWVVAWSLKRTPSQGALAGVILGLLQDGMSSGAPTHVFSLALVGYLTARLQKQRYLQEDFISVALIVFGMSIVADTVRALQFTVMSDRSLEEIWMLHQPLALSSAILSSLWAPTISFPLNRWWQRMERLEQS